MFTLIPSVHCTDNYEDVLFDVLSCINTDVQQTPNVIITGDFNIFLTASPKVIITGVYCQTFMSENNLQLCGKFIDNKDSPLYTFCAAGLEHTSFIIDHIFGQQ